MNKTTVLKRRSKLILALALVMVLVLAMVAGCGGGGGGGGAATTTGVAETTAATTAAAAETTAATTSAGAAAEAQGAASDLDYVELTFLLLGDPPTDAKTVEDAINEKLMEKLNCKISIQNPTWTDWNQKYRNELIAGTVDMLYTASWGDYVIYANEGAFLELDDLLVSAVPDLKARVDSQLDMMRVKGTIYAVPNLWPEYECKGLMYREDLRKNLSLPVPNTLENLEEYLLGVQANDPEQILISYGYVEPTTVGNYFLMFDAFNMKYDWISLGYGYWYSYANPTVTVDYWYSQDFIDDSKLIKKWCDYGFWSRSCLSEVVPEFPVELGIMVAHVSGQNPNKFSEAIPRIEKDNPDWELEYFAYGEVNGGSVYPAHARQNATAIARTCKNPDRALQVVEYIMLDQEMHNLFHYGIEGVHYEMKDDIYYNLSPSGATEAFKYEGYNSWNLRNGEYKLSRPSDPVLNEIFDRLDAIAAKCKYPRVNIESGFQEDYTDYVAERTAVINVMAEYLAPIQAGLVSDVEASIAEFLSRAESAGLQTCRENYDKQYKEYLEEFGYN